MTTTWADTINATIDRVAEWHDDVKCPDTIEGIDDFGPAPQDIVPSSYVWVLSQSGYNQGVFATVDAGKAWVQEQYAGPVVWTERFANGWRSYDTGHLLERYEVRS